MKDIPLINLNKTLRETINEINESGFGLAFIVDNKKRLKGVVSDGDIRRALLKGISINDKVFKVMNKNPIKFYDYWDREKIIENIERLKKENIIPKLKTLLIPVISREGKIKKVIGIEPERKFFFDLVKRRYKKTKKILIIGGGGYIGSVLTRMLLKRGYFVKVFDNLLYGGTGLRGINSKNFKFLKGDITNISNIVEAMNDIDTIIHLGAIVGEPASNIKPRETLEINYFSTKTIGEIAKYLGIRKFIFASSCSVYGYKKTICDEETKPNPLSLYAETKLLSEKALLELKDSGFSPVILRFATAFGYSPRMRFDLVVNLLIAKAIKEKTITVYGNGKQIRPFIHIKDISRAIIKVLEADNGRISGEIFNVGSEKMNMSILEVAKKIKECVPEAEIVFLKEKEDNRNYSVSFKKIKKILKFDTKYYIDYAVKEIKEVFNKGEIKNFYSKIYSNFHSLKEK